MNDIYRVGLAADEVVTSWVGGYELFWELHGANKFTIMFQISKERLFYLDFAKLELEFFLRPTVDQFIWVWGLPLGPLTRFYLTKRQV
jgi:hypothetical protein